MKYIKYFLLKVIKCIKGVALRLSPVLLSLFFIILIFAVDGYTWEDFGLDGFSLNPNDYCNLTDVEYTAVLQDTTRRKGKCGNYRISHI